MKTTKYGIKGSTFLHTINIISLAEVSVPSMNELVGGCYHSQLKVCCLLIPA